MLGITIDDGPLIAASSVLKITNNFEYTKQMGIFARNHATERHEN